MHGDPAHMRHFHGGDPPSPSAAWLDLSTGVNPTAYPLAIDPALLARLPRRADLARLLTAARRAYRVPDTWSIIAAPGTHALIAAIARQRSGRTAVVSPTYGEHGAVFRRTTQVERVAEPAEGAGADTLVVVNPNNPDGRQFVDLTKVCVERAAAARDCLTVIDEAFADLVPPLSVIPGGPPQTLVLRSVGKFYGLGGLRLAFAAGDPELIAPIEEAIGPWPVSGPALAVSAALGDDVWASAMRRELSAQRVALDDTLTEAGWTVTGGTDLFRLIDAPNARELHNHLAAHHIWTRVFDYNPRWFRLGLPGADLPRLAGALKSFSGSHV
ncbi:MAG: aminotransferase class I/II-fold pyridoxal phosphate-dependent enzyme [Pseudomonadota bacterium]